jgi:alpha-tubulin suppressor-like RCC1 family protein
LGYHLPQADVQFTPRTVEFSLDSPIVQIDAGKYHTLAVNAKGKCFSWGFGK